VKHDSSPDIQVAYGPAGRETISAIAEDLTAKPVRRETSPELEFHLVPAGRETLAAITAEVGGVVPSDFDTEAGNGEEPKTGVRPRLPTRGYSQPPPERSSSPRMTMPGVAPPAPGARKPEVREAKVGRDTLDAIANAVLSEPGAPASGRVKSAALEVYELATFVVRGEDLTLLSSEAARREFVAERLVHRLPVSTMDQVDRIDVTPWTVRGTVVLRVWCRVRPPMR
jgi:hypothetical protein